MTFPNLLGIGAMKAGTRSFYELLRTTPRVSVTLDHEPAVLCASTDRATALRLYGRQFPGKRASAAIRADVSTMYAKRPVIDGVAERARALLGEDTTIVYLVRDPIARMQSQVRHQMATGSIEPMPWVDVLRRYPQVVSYSRYGYQLEPWLEHFPDRVRIVLLDDLIDRPDAILHALFDLAGLGEHQAFPSEMPELNTSDDIRQVPRWIHRLARNPTYRRVVRPLVPAEALRSSRKRMGSVAGTPPDEFVSERHEEVVDLLTSEFEDILEHPARLRP